MEREVGGGIGMGNTCKPMAVSFQCMTKSTTNKKIKKIKNKEKLKKKKIKSSRAKIESFLISTQSLGIILHGSWLYPLDA